MTLKLITGVACGLATAFLLAAGSFLFAGILALFIPETRDRELV